MFTLSFKQAKAICKLSNKDSTRYYTNGAHIKQGEVEITNAIYALRFKADVSPTDEFCILSRAVLEGTIKVAKAKNQDAVECGGDGEWISGQFPNSEPAWERAKSDNPSVSFGIDELIRLLQGARELMGKTGQVSIQNPGDNRPVYFTFVSSGEQVAEAILVPARS